MASPLSMKTRPTTTYGWKQRTPSSAGKASHTHTDTGIVYSEIVLQSLTCYAWPLIEAYPDANSWWA
ncbi:hypothetical protein N7522_004899 [Penicillium canescens]|uniref:Uncharacterized protein n=1 Tax=Penicillium canescens TaxID=5083 RepID=A0AAD6N325_PENCN|nr:uncharacterized protein N7446_004777 [Penicillium canescens]KAJ6009883.1 hypothetical protein N7522_004899 [Penicillium canescens]KAJ6026622.1 hypothetical protein N7460_011439 [Penicillium canescens]KAJ6039903.1 hypothetical protein N7444_008808 [Penicillium canescens]KAJ6067740.1 hypothetical protein N7446_004777 [Penicillium canescens]